MAGVSLSMHGEKCPNSGGEEGLKCDACGGGGGSFSPRSQLGAFDDWWGPGRGTRTLYFRG